MNKILTVLFTRLGDPQSGLTPTVDVYEITTTTDTLVINDAAVSEIGNGLYKYVHTSYDPNKSYIYYFDGGASQLKGERYQVAVNESFGEDVAAKVWDEDATIHTITDSTGDKLNKTLASAQQVQIDVATLQGIVDTLLKYHKNRTKIDYTTGTLTVYEDDQTTPLRIFNLRDRNGTFNETEVAERVPQ